MGNLNNEDESVILDIKNLFKSWFRKFKQVLKLSQLH